MKLYPKKELYDFKRFIFKKKDLLACGNFQKFYFFIFNSHSCIRIEKKLHEYNYLFLIKNERSKKKHMLFPINY